MYHLARWWLRLAEEQFKELVLEGRASSIDSIRSRLCSQNRPEGRCDQACAVRMAPRGDVV